MAVVRVVVSKGSRKVAPPQHQVVAQLLHHEVVVRSLRDPAYQDPVEMEPQKTHIERRRERVDGNKHFVIV